MGENPLIGLFSQSAPQQALAKSTSRELSIRGLVGSSLAVAIATHFSKKGGYQLVISESAQQCAYLYNDIANLIGEKGVFMLPSAYKKSILFGTLDESAQVQRTALLAYLGAANQGAIICTYPEALIESLATMSDLSSGSISISVGEKLSTKFLQDTLHEYGFTKVDFVHRPGQYALRGSIVDIFSYSNNHPYRVDMFSDEVDSIRIFDINSQLSVQKLERIDIVASLDEGRAVGVSIIELLLSASQESTLWTKGMDQIIERIKALRVKLIKAVNEDQTKRQLLDSTVGLKDIEESASKMRRFSLQEELAAEVITFGTTPQPAFNKNFELLCANLAENSLAGIKNYIITENKAQIERLENIFSSIGEGQIYFENLSTTLHQGFISQDIKCALYTDHQIFERHHRYSSRNELPKSAAITIAELEALRPGDYVVHIDHGVGKYGGLMKSREGDKVHDVVKIVYLNDDILLVNVHSLHKISKYRDKDDMPPKLNRLGSPSWNKLKNNAKSKIKDIAADLIKLYAERKSQSGFAFSPDSYLQTELEASFIYEDTPDQQKVTEQVKGDMELAIPMDRLVCGDVGFGKTEIAIRAAFKAATDGKQVAVLVPTTVLALQHYRSFTKRLKEFPVTVEQLSRVRTAGQTKEILARLEKGEIDILIGTHKILGKTVVFKDLGMLIIDEEQKFGVSSKEKLRQLRQNIDTLTLTATPIPRTLQFSLLGARDLSIIKTPPPNRQSVDTQVLPFSVGLIAEAIEAEMERGGQTYFIHNRVQSIEHMASIISSVVPSARIAIGHGQMPAEKLERVMMDFIYGEYDVLLATTIIESGIDIPSANTIIINDAQNFGLSDLHQLRGRVGRTNKKAYCYLLTPEEGLLSDASQRRLTTIEDFSELGSGFNIAMQDLDIRGAGNLLGGEQSGFITQIGYETYQQILQEAVMELREQMHEELKEILPQGESQKHHYVTSCQLDTDIEASIPDSYCPSVTEKIRLYKRINNVTSQDEMQRFMSELSDRFGVIPTPTMELLQLVVLRNMAIELAFEKVILKNGYLILHFISQPQNSYYSSEQFRRTIEYVQTLDGGRFKMKNKDGKFFISIAKVPTSAKAKEILSKFATAILS